MTTRTPPPPSAHELSEDRWYEEDEVSDTNTEVSGPIDGLQEEDGKKTCPRFGDDCKFLPSGNCRHVSFEVKPCPVFGKNCKFVADGKCTHKAPPRASRAPPSAHNERAVLEAEIALAEMRLRLAKLNAGGGAKPSGVPCKFNARCTRKDCTFTHTYPVCKHHLGPRGCDRHADGKCAFRHPV